MKLAVFDFDSTLMDGETIDILADEFKIGDEVKKITHQAMNGELDFFESLIKRVSLLKGMDYKKVVELCENLPLMKGSYEIVTELKQMGYKVVCFSGGFRVGTTPARKKLKLDADFSNILHEKKGVLTGLVGGDMMFGYSKGDMIQRLQSILNITKDNTLVCGDGANDLSMFEYATTKIAFCAKEVLKKEASIVVDEKDLTKILDYVKE